MSNRGGVEPDFNRDDLSEHPSKGSLWPLDPHIVALLRSDEPISYEHEIGCHEAVAKAQALRGSVRAATTNDRDLDGTAASRAKVRCPQCGTPNPFASNDSLQQIRCEHCGEDFALVGEDETAEYLRIGRRLGHFELLDEVGSGTFGSVWRARDTELERIVAVKIPHREEMSVRDNERFLHEARAAAVLRHPHIVSVHEIGRDQGIIFIVSDFVDGMTLADFLTAKHLTAREAARLCTTIADALQHAHDHGIVHRDLKPSNIGLDQQRQPYVMDFGLALRDSVEMTMTADGRILGTPAYMAPEQARGDSQTADARSDIYSLGVILFELLTGERPFRGNLRMLLHQVLHDEPPHPRKLNNSIPRDLATICLKCLEKSPERRYPSSRALQEDLDHFLAGRPIVARPVGSLERGLRWCARNRAIAGLAGLFTLSLMLGTGLSTWKWREAVSFANLAQKEQARAEQSAASMQRQSAWLQYQRGRQLCENQQAAQGLHWMHQALSNFPDTPEAEHERRLVFEDIVDWRKQLPKRRWLFNVPNEVTAFTISLDGQWLLTGEKGGLVRRFDLETGKEHGQPIQLERTDLASFGVWCLESHPDGESILACTGVLSTEEGLGRVHRIDLKSGSILEKVAEFPGYAETARYSPSGRWIAYLGGSLNGPGKLWLKESGSGTHWNKSLSLPSTYQDIAFTPNERHIIVEDRQTGELRCVVVQNWEFVDLQQYPEVLESVKIASSDREGRRLRSQAGSRLTLADTLLPRRFHPDATLMLSCDYRGTLRIVDAMTRQPVQTIALGARQFGWSPNGRQLACIQGQQVFVWDLPFNPSLRATASIAEGLVESSPMKNAALSLNAEHAVAVTSGEPHISRIVDLRTGLPIGRPLYHPLPVVRVAAISSDGRCCATACQRWDSIECLVRLWDLRTGQPLTDWMPQENWVATIAFSPDGRHMVSSNYATMSWVWDLEPLQESVRQQASDGQTADLVTPAKIGHCIKSLDIILSSEISPDGSKLLLGTASDWSGKPMATLWNLKTHEQIVSDMLHGHYVSHVEFSSDGELCLTCSADGQAKTWNADRGTLVATISYSAQLGPAKLVDDGRLVLTGSSDGVVRMWDAQTGIGLENASLTREHDRVTALAMSDDGSRVVVGYASGAAQLVDRASFMPIGPARVFRSPIHSVDFDASGEFWVALCESGWVGRWPTRAIPSDLQLDPSSLEADRRQLEVETGFAFDVAALDVVSLTPSDWANQSSRVASDSESVLSRYTAGDNADDAQLNRLNHAMEESNVQAIEYCLNRMQADHDASVITDWQIAALYGDCAVMRRDFDAAQTSYCQLDNLVTNTSAIHDWQRHRVATSIASQRWSAAEWYLDRLLHQYPNDWTLYRDRADLFQNWEKVDRRRADLDRALALNPDRRFIVFVAAERASQEDWVSAADLYDRTSQQGYDTLEDMRHHVVSLIEVGDLERLKNCLRDILDDTDRSTNLTLGYGRTVVILCYWGALHDEDIPRMLKLAERTYKRELLDNQPVQHGLDLQHFGLALYRGGEFQRAIDTFEESRSLVGRDTEPCLLGLALSHAALGNLNTAREFNERLSGDAYHAGLKDKLEQAAFRHLTAELDNLLKEEG